MLERRTLLAASETSQTGYFGAGINREPRTLYNPYMTSGTYAVVSYLNGALADFVQGLRARLAPDEEHVRPHLTLLSPRVLESPPEKLHSALKRICYDARPVAVSLGEVESFVPATNTVYLQVNGGACEVRSLHERLNQYGFRADDTWPYVPHVTLATLDGQSIVADVLEEARQQWKLYAGGRDFVINKLTVVREMSPGLWNDLASVPLPSAHLRSANAPSA
jgi:2'-5' RNA ligase